MEPPTSSSIAITNQQQSQHPPQVHNNNTSIDSGSSSISQERSNDGTMPTDISKTLPMCYPRCCGKPVFHGNAEAFAWGLDQMGRGIAYIGVAVFLGTALLQLAQEAAGCPADATQCENRVHGVKPSSLLTTYASIVSVLSSLMMPLVGAFIDFSPHRLLFGRITTAAYVILLFPTIFVNDRTWFAMTIIMFVGIFIGWAQAAVAYAYLPDLTRDESIMAEYTRSFTILIFSSTVAYLAITVGSAWALGFKDDNVAMAKFGMSIAFVLSLITEVWSWSLFEKRPAARALPEGKSLVTSGFEQLCRTSRNIVGQYRALMWFYLSHAMSESAIMSLSSIAITFFTDQLKMTATQNAIAAFLILISSIPGALCSEWCNKRINPIRSSIIALVILIATTLIVSLVLTGKQSQSITYILSACWGLGIGWKLTADELVSATIIPEGQDAELMAVYLFSGEVLAWLPPLVFSVVNESGLSQQYGIGFLCVLWTISILFLLCFGSYSDARETSNRAKSSAEMEMLSQEANLTKVEANDVDHGSDETHDSNSNNSTNYINGQDESATRFLSPSDDDECKQIVTRIDHQHPPMMVDNGEIS